jgi:hypothetical protein
MLFTTLVFLLIICLSVLVLLPISVKAGVRRARARMMILHSSDRELIHRLHGHHGADKSSDAPWYHNRLYCAFEEC